MWLVFYYLYLIYLQAFYELLESKVIKVDEVDGLKLVKEFAATLEKQVASKNTVLLVRIY